jgi:demethylmenaquinone methyltransferase/2-methoxy-6-polyprenyl-1,4-benzoquinol methylase
MHAKACRKEVNMNSELLYKVISRFYDLLDITYFANFDRRPRKAVLQYINDREKVLDICTGTATNAIRIAKQKPSTKVVGIDLSKDMLKIAQLKIKNEGIKNIRLKNMDATSLDFKDNVFDKVLISLILHELDEQLAEKIVKEANRVLKDNGEIIVTEWEPSEESWRRLLFLPIHMLEPKEYRVFIKKNLSQYFENMSLQIVDIVHCNYSKVLRLRKIALHK